MSLYGDMTNQANNNDAIWKALSDATRREILDMLAERPLSTGEIVERFGKELCRTAVMKHLEILVDANLVFVRREGRFRWNYLNPVPIQQVCDRWVSKHVRKIASAASRLKQVVEEREENKRLAKKKSSTKKTTAKKTTNKPTRSKKTNKQT